MTNRYEEMRLKHQKEFNDFPMKFAFSNKQFEESMAELGLTVNDTDKVYAAPGGGFYRKEDAPRLKEMYERFEKEEREAIESDKTGEGFIYEMFLYELDNHEYGYTYDLRDTLDALGYTVEEIKADQRLYAGLKKAVEEIKNREDY